MCCCVQIKVHFHFDTERAEEGRQLSMATLYRNQEKRPLLMEETREKEIEVKMHTERAEYIYTEESSSSKVLCVVYYKAVCA